MRINWVHPHFTLLVKRKCIDQHLDVSWWFIHKWRYVTVYSTSAFLNYGSLLSGKQFPWWNSVMMMLIKTTLICFFFICHTTCPNCLRRRPRLLRDYRLGNERKWEWSHRRNFQPKATMPIGWPPRSYCSDAQDINDKEYSPWNVMTNSPSFRIWILIYARRTDSL